MVEPARYWVRIGESYSLGEEIDYNALVARILEFTVRAALARSIDEADWEHDVLRRRGLMALQIVRNGRAIWADGTTFEEDLAEARRELDSRFEERNELDPTLYDALNRDLRERWRRLGYEIPCLLRDMKKLFRQLETDATERAARTREGFLNELMNG